MRIDLLSLFPSYFRGPFDVSIIKRARENGILDINLVDVREYSGNRQHKVDDRPYGGGPGMVMMAPPLATAIRHTKEKSANSRVIYLSPQGSLLTAAKCRELASESHLITVCGHYEGIDERIIRSYVDEELSIGDYVLTNGCAAAIVLLDAVVRFIPGVLGHQQAAGQDSFGDGGIFDCPHYTRPEIFEGNGVPKILLSGDHAAIAKWRRERAFEKTKKVRPELLQ